ncbi:MAG: hypothetical protein ACK500_10545 [Flavobacteriales bacterium]
MTGPLKHYKWKLAWGGFVLLLMCFLFITVKFNGSSWFGIFLQTAGTVLTLYPTIIIFAQSRRESEDAHNRHLTHLQELNNTEINEMRVLFQQQMDTLSKNTALQVEELRRLTGEQIAALQVNTQKQIDHYAQQTEKIVLELNTNSQLLAEILLRQLEDATEKAQKELSRAEAAYRDLSGFKIGRTRPEREQQLIRQRGIISRLKSWLDYLKDKCNELHKYLGYE